jgi:hypothetical protein
MVLFLQQAQMFVQLPHLDTDKGANFDGGVEFFYTGTIGNRQVPNYPTIPIFIKVLTAIFCYCSYTWDVHITLVNAQNASATKIVASS